MEEASNKPSRDIVEEEYKGPSAVAAAAGEGYIAHFVYAALGLTVGGLITYVFHKQAASVVNNLRTHFNKGAETGSFLVRWPSKFAIGILGHGKDAALSPETFAKFEQEHRYGFGQWLINHVPGVKHLIKTADDDRMSTAITSGGILAAFGFFVMPLILGFRGARKGAEGRHQFERAKDAIIDLRAQNDQLRQHNDALRAQYDNIQLPHADDSQTTQADAAELPAEQLAPTAPDATATDAQDVQKTAPAAPDTPIAAQPAPVIQDTPAITEQDIKKDIPATPESPAPVAAPAEPASGTRPAPVQKDGNWGDGIRQQQAAQADQQSAIA